MRKFFAISISIGVVLMILTVGFSSRAASRSLLDFSFEESVEALGASSLTALRSVVDEVATRSVTPDVNSEMRAVEVVEGDSVSFRELGITVQSVSETLDCSTNCLEVEIGVSTAGEEVAVTSHKEGDAFLYNGYRIKISQIAPHKPENGVLRRVVFLFSVE